MNAPLRRDMQHSLHALSVTRGGTEKRIVATRRRREPCRHHSALVAHRRPRDHARIVLRNDALVVFDALVDGFELSWPHEHPVVTSAQILAAVMKRERD